MIQQHKLDIKYKCNKLHKGYNKKEKTANKQNSFTANKKQEGHGDTSKLHM